MSPVLPGISSVNVITKMEDSGGSFEGKSFVIYTYISSEVCIVYYQLGELFDWSQLSFHGYFLFLIKKFPNHLAVKSVKSNCAPFNVVC